MTLLNLLERMVLRSAKRRQRPGTRPVRSYQTARLAIEMLEDRLCLSVDLFVASYANHSVLRYDGNSGAFIDAFVPSGSGGLNGPHGLDFGFDGNLYVSSVNTNSVLRYDGTTGAFIDAFVPSGSGGLGRAVSGIFGADGNLYVSSAVFGGAVTRYDGTTGAFIDAFVTPGSGGLGIPLGLVFGPDRNLYINSVGPSSVMRYDGTTGAPLPAPGQPGAFFAAPNSGGLDSPFGNPVFDGDGNLLVPSYYTNNVLRYNGTTGAFIDAFVPFGSGALSGPEGLSFGPDGNLYVVSQGTESVLRYDGATGAFIDAFVPAGSGGLVAATYLRFWNSGGARGAPRQPQLVPLFVQVAASQPETVFQGTLVQTTTPIQKPVQEIRIDQPAQPQTNSNPTAARHALDAVFERWGDPVVDVLAVNLSKDLT